MRHLINWQAFRVGMRTLKTILSVGITLGLFELWHRQPAVLAALSAVFTIRTEHRSTVTYGKIRLFGNILGILIALSIVQISLIIGLPAAWLRIFGSMLGILLVIVLCNAFNRSQSIISSSATFFVVFLNTPTEHLLNYGANRILDTIIGASIAIIINYLLPNQQDQTA